jgi:hypothetical protein
MFGVSDFHRLRFDHSIARVVIAITDEDSVPSNSIKFAGTLFRWLNDPGLASEGAKETVVGNLFEELFEGAELTFAERGKTVGSQSCSTNCLSPPLLGETRLNKHAAGHVDYSFISPLRNGIMLRGVWGSDIMLDTTGLEDIGKSVVAELTTTIIDEFLHLALGLSLVKGFEVKNCLSGVRFPMK